MSDPQRTKPRNNADFYRACRYLGPHRRIVVISILCAFFVGAAFTGGLGTMLPVFKILLSGQSVQDWMNSRVVEHRLHIKLSDDPTAVRVERLDGHPRIPVGPAQAIWIDGANAPATPSAVLDYLANPANEIVPIVDPNSATGVQSVALQAVPWHYRTGRRLVAPLPTKPVWAIGCVLAVIAVLTIVGNIVRFFQEYLSDKAAILAVNDIRRQLYDHVLHIPMSYFGMKGTSDVTSRLVQDAQGLQDGFKTVLGQSIQEPIKAVMALALALFLSWKLVLFLGLFGPLAVLVIRKFGKKMRRASRRALQNSSSMLGQIEGSLIGIRVVKASLAERFERRRYRTIMQGLVGEQLKMSRIDAFNPPIMETLNLLAVATVVLYASYLVLVAKTLEPSTFLLVMACLVGMGEALRRMSKVNNVLQKSNAAAARIFETLDIPVEMGSGIRSQAAQLKRVQRGAASNELAADRLTNIPSIQRSLTFEDITFSYHNAPSPALTNVSLTVEKGKCIAVVGRNGSGKTTLLAMLPRFYDPQQGRVLIDGVDIRRATLRSLRRQIGIVTQDSVIFPGTIASNIAYGQPLATREAIIAAAKRAFAHDFILEKADGYDTILGEHGASLSGGQKQRLCIARAILRQTPILILDEATSQVDSESEHLIQQAIESLIHERTTFVIAHRFSTILSADSIVVMDKGQIVGQGKHEQLLQTCPLYQQLYERQLFAAPAVA